VNIGDTKVEETSISSPEKIFIFNILFSARSLTNLIDINMYNGNNKKEYVLTSVDMPKDARLKYKYNVYFSEEKLLIIKIMEINIKNEAIISVWPITPTLINVNVPNQRMLNHLFLNVL
jgi:hypothetical protein